GSGGGGGGGEKKTEAVAQEETETGTGTGTGTDAETEAPRELVMEGETVAEPEVRRPSKPTRPAAKKPEPRAEAGPPGYYLVDSRPYARIYIDGKDHGETPLFRVPLAPGKHQVKAVLPDGRKKQFTIDIKSGKDLSSGRLKWSSPPKREAP